MNDPTETVADRRLEIVRALGDSPNLAQTINAAAKLQRLGDGARTVRIAFLRNITLEPALPALLTVEAARAGLNATVDLGDFEGAQATAHDSTSSLYANNPDVIVVALRLQALAPQLLSSFASLSAPQIEELIASAVSALGGLLRAVRERSTALLLVHNFERPIEPALGILDGRANPGQLAAIGDLNARLASVVTAFDAAHVVDIDHLLAQAGYEASLDDRFWHIGRAPYSVAFLGRLAKRYMAYIAALTGKAKKCLVLDCDNTLWGGVIGEDGMNGIALGPTHPGSAFRDFHAAILDLYARGVLLAINSKNNEADALEVLRAHPDSLLRPEHFVNMKINWDDKVANLRAIAAELNIGLDSLVFVDDNAFECQLVRERLPQVTVLELPADPTRYARMLRGGTWFETLARGEEDRRRSEMYRTEAKRSELRAASGSLDDYLASLEMNLTIAPVEEAQVARVAQLTQKTNQFNLTTRRYGEAEIRAMIADPAWQVLYAQLTDRFDASGIIAVALVHDDGEAARIDTLLMSCRVIGRGVETALIAQIVHDARQRGMRTVTGEFLPTAKNGQVAAFYANAGFTARGAGADQWWDLAASAAAPVAPRWFARITAPHTAVPA